MKDFRADIHIHTVLSPCGDFSMTPAGIIETALKKKIDLIGITDHNTTRHCELISKLGEKEGIVVIPGVEINSIEEVHCVCLFPDMETVKDFQAFIDDHLIVYPHDHEILGDQVEVDENENIIYRENRSLISSLDCSVEQIETAVHAMGGLFIPAHINRPGNGILEQLGFIPENLSCDAYEIRPELNREFGENRNLNRNMPFIMSSDAHYIEDIGRRTTILYMEEPSFRELKMALAGLDGRKVKN